MGCASSKQKRCRHCHCDAPYSPVTRSYSMHVHHPPQTDGDSYHVVALTSTSLDTLKLNTPSSNHRQPPNESFRFANDGFIQNKEKEKGEKKDDFSMGLIEAKAWSNMIDQKLPKIVPMTPTMTPPGEPETINTWELMEGLEDTSPFRSPNRMRSFSFDVSVSGNDIDEFDHPPKLSFRVTENVTGSPIRPLWLQMTEEESKLNPAISDFDPEVLSSFRKTMQQLSPDNLFHLKQAPIDDEKQGTEKGFSSEENKTTCGVFVDGVKLASCGKDKVVLYFTSLRGVRKTYEDCCQVRLILKGCGVRVDERDVSMHSGFKEELKELLGESFGGVRLPRVFIGRNYIGGADEIQKLHEDGKLDKLLECCEKIENGNGCDGWGECELCGDIRFIPCETCSGSCKIYYECDEEEEDDGGGGGEIDDYGFQRCPDCNENGLIRCPMCCY